MFTKAIKVVIISTGDKTMGNNSKWKNKYAVKTAFDDLDFSNDEITDIIREKIELRNKFLKRAELKPMAKVRDDEDSHGTSRTQHMRQAAEIAKEIAHRLGLNETVAYIGMLMHDAGHSFFGHEGEHAMSVIGKLLNVGYYHHNAKGIDVILSENIINEIVEAIPEAKEDKELQERLKNDAWYFLDIVVSHDGEASSKDTKIKKTNNSPKLNIKEIVLNKVRKSNRENLYKCDPETLEGVISKPSDVIAYIKTDMIDAFSEGIITRLDDDHFEIIGNILCETTEERNQNLKSINAEELRKRRIDKAKKLLLEYRKKHLRELPEDIDEEKMQVVESIMDQAANEGIDIFDIIVEDDMEADIKRLKKELKENKVPLKEYAATIKNAKQEFVKKYKINAKSQIRINEILENKLKEYSEKRIQEGADSNTIASEKNKIEEYLQKLTKERKRVVEEIMNDIQEALINDYIDTTKQKWDKLDNYEDMKIAMSFSEGMSEALLKKLKVINYEKYVQHTKKIYQERSVPDAVLKTVKECANALIRTGVIRDKFYDSTVLSKIENDEVKSAMKVPERSEEEYQKYRRSIGISKGVKLIRPKKSNKKLRFTNPKGTKNIWKNKLYKEMYSYVQRQDTRFAMNCEDVYFAIENTIRTKVNDAYNPNFVPEDYLRNEQNSELKNIRYEIEQINLQEHDIEKAKETYIKQKIESERNNLEEKVATEIAIRYLAGMTDKKIIKTLLKTGNLSKLTYKKEDKINQEGNSVIKGLIKSHGEQKEEEQEK